MSPEIVKRATPKALDYQVILESGPDFVALLDRDGRIKYITSAVTRIGGYLQDELFGKWFVDFIHPEDRPKAMQNFETVLKADAGAVVESSHRYRQKDGSWRYIETLSRNYLNDPGIDGVIVNTRDVTARMHALESLRKVTRARNALLAASSAVGHVVEESVLLKKVCELAVNLGYRMAWIGYAQPNYVVAPMAYAGMDEGYLTRAEIRWDASDRGRGPTGTAIRTGQAQVNQDFVNNPRMAPWRANALQRGFASSIALPLMDEFRCFGALMVYAPEPDAFNADEVDLLEQLAEEVSHGIAMIRARQKSIEHQASLQAALEGSIQAIAATLEKRDPYTAGHERRVAALSSAIANELGMSEGDIHGLYLAATIHDLGKIQVPSEILTKPGRLTSLEFELMKLHPQIGHDIVKDIKFPWPVAQIMLQHHERMDGSGYPRGLKGSEILVQAQIVAVADVVEAMASHRPYRPALGLEAAFKEISEFKGIRYDEKVVDVCKRIFEEGRFSFPKAA